MHKKMIFEKSKYDIIMIAFSDLDFIHGTHTPKDRTVFQGEVKELLCSPYYNLVPLQSQQYLKNYVKVAR
jgi:hypothetical protein